MTNSSTAEIRVRTSPIGHVFHRRLDRYPLGGIMLAMAHKHGAQAAETGKIVRRLKVIEGQIRGLQEMIKNDTYCVDVITQTSAVKQGLSNVEDLILENHLSTCVVKQIRSGDSKKAVGEVLTVYKLKRK